MKNLPLSIFLHLLIYLDGSYDSKDSTCKHRTYDYGEACRHLAEQWYVAECTAEGDCGKHTECCGFFLLEISLSVLDGVETDFPLELSFSSQT